jgi:hypothetical protein
MRTNQEQTKKYVALVLVSLIVVVFSLMTATMGLTYKYIPTSAPNPIIAYPSLTPTIPAQSTNHALSPTMELYSPNGLYVARKYEAGSYPSGTETIVIQNLDGVVLQKIPFDEKASQPDKKTLQEIQEKYPAFIHQPSIDMTTWSSDSPELVFFYRMYIDNSHTRWIGYNFQKINVETGVIQDVKSLQDGTPTY